MRPPVSARIDGIAARFASLARAGWTLTLGLALTACASSRVPGNQERILYAPEKATNADSYAAQYGGFIDDKVAHGYCPSPGVSNFILPSAPRKPGMEPPREIAMRYSMGDRFNITVPGMDDFSGDYVISADGRVILPFAGEFNAIGMTNAELQRRVEQAFIKAGVFRADGLRISVRPVQFAPINIPVQGAVFDPGRVTINNIRDADKNEKIMTRFGDAPLDRFIPSVLRAAGGIRPDADVSSIFLMRGGKTYQLNWRGTFTGEAVDDVALVEGDRIFVPEAPCFQSGLIRPSQITPPGIHVWFSNLTVPATSNATSAISSQTTGVTYGTRFLQGLVNANCVGGTLASNAGRHGVLISRNPKTLRTEVIQRSIEELVRNPERDALNPHLMPEDAIACYDSSVIDAASVVSSMTSFVTGAAIGKSLK